MLLCVYRLCARWRSEMREAVTKESDRLAIPMAYAQLSTGVDAYFPSFRGPNVGFSVCDQEKS